MSLTGKIDVSQAQSSEDFGKGEIVATGKAHDATRIEHELTMKDAFKLYRPAIGWSFLFSLGVIMVLTFSTTAVIAEANRAGWF